MNTNTISPALLGFFRAIGMIFLTSVLAYVGKENNLSFLNPETALIISSAALFLEHAMSPSGTALFGRVNV